MNVPTLFTHSSRWMLLIGLLFTAGLASAQDPLTASGETRQPAPADASNPVYKIERDDGSVLFTDTPAPNSQPITLNSNTANVAAALPTPTAPTTAAPGGDTKQIPYKLAILQPAPEATIRSDRGQLKVVAQASPANAGRLQVVIDGKVMGTSRTGQFALSGIHRGAHQLQVRLIDNKGKTLASSAQQTFFMHQASALINPPAGQ